MASKGGPSSSSNGGTAEAGRGDEALLENQVSTSIIHNLVTFPACDAI